jgi:LPS-assembly protein
VTTLRLSHRRLRSRRRRGRGAALAIALAVAAIGICGGLARAQQQLTFPNRPPPATRSGPGALNAVNSGSSQMLVRADEIDYDYTNDRVSAVGNVQIYLAGSTLESDRVIYDQKTKRLHAEGNVRLSDPDGKVTYGQIVDLSDNFRDGFVDSLRVDLPDQTRVASTRAERKGGNFSVFENSVYTACEPCKDNPLKPPEWQVKAARMIHDQDEKMIYFEDARLELYGVPIAYTPYFSTPDPTVKRKTGFLVPTASTSSLYGVGLTVPYYWALAPDYDATFMPMITTRQGPLLQGAPTASARPAFSSSTSRRSRPPAISPASRIFAAASSRAASSACPTNGSGDGTGPSSPTRRSSPTTGSGSSLRTIRR